MIDKFWCVFYVLQCSYIKMANCIVIMTDNNSNSNIFAAPLYFRTWRHYRNCTNF